MNKDNVTLNLGMLRLTQPTTDSNGCALSDNSGTSEWVVSHDYKQQKPE